MTATTTDMTGFQCKLCGHAAPIGIGYAAPDRPLSDSVGLYECDCGYSWTPNARLAELLERSPWEDDELDPRAAVVAAARRRIERGVARENLAILGALDALEDDAARHLMTQLLGTVPDALVLSVPTPALF